LETQPETRHTHRSWLYAWWPVLLGIALIGSTSSDLFSSQHTSGPFRWLYETLFGPVSNAHWAMLHAAIRKSCHFLGYGVFGLLWLRAWRLTLPRLHFTQHALFSVLGAGLVASADEFHQTFIPTRTGTPRDVLLDCCGVIFMQIVIYTAMRIAKPGKLANAA